jgi:hypothetical protein
VLCSAILAKAPYTYRLMQGGEAEGLLTARAGVVLFIAIASLRDFVRGPWLKYILCFVFCRFKAIGTSRQGR